jgi:hypothetical protein
LVRHRARRPRHPPFGGPLQHSRISRAPPHANVPAAPPRPPRVHGAPSSSPWKGCVGSRRARRAHAAATSARGTTPRCKYKQTRVRRPPRIPAPRGAFGRPCQCHSCIGSSCQRHCVHGDPIHAQYMGVGVARLKEEAMVARCCWGELWRVLRCMMTLLRTGHCRSCSERAITSAERRLSGG